MRHAPEFAFLALLVGTGCTSGDFDEDFAFGVAVAGFQVEAGCPTINPAICEDRYSDWYHFVTSTVTVSRSNNFLAGDPIANGPGFYELYEADLDRAADMGLTHFRFSIEWSRIFPDPTIGTDGYEGLKRVANPAGVAYYHALIDAIRARKMTPFVTLHHYTLPDWIHDAVGCNTNLATCSPRGWLDANIIPEIAKYAGFCAKEFGADVDMWATQNEPFAVLLPGYLQPTETRTNPPAQSLRLEEAKTVLLTMIDAHAAMADAVHENDPGAQVGLVYNVTPIHPKDPNKPLDRRAAKNIDHLFNGVFLDAILLGRLDDDLDGEGEVQPHLVGRTDFLGVNYYTRVVLEGTEDSLFPAFSPLATFDILTLEQGEVYPVGMYETLTKLRDEYPNTPLFISENGADVGMVPELDRFLVEHLSYVKRAIDDGVDVRGYYYWTLMDNYEWNHGFNLRFGLFDVDTTDESKPRTPRPVVDVYRQIATERAFGDLADRFPIPE